MPTGTYDVFLSHSASDKEAVEILAHKLVDAGLKPWLDKWDIVPGTLWQSSLIAGLNASECTAVFIGSSGAGPWENAEMMVALDRALRDQTNRVIPVLLPGAPTAPHLKLPAFLNLFSWIDFRSGLDDSDALRRLIAGIRGESPGMGESTVTVTQRAAVANNFKLPKLPNWKFDPRVAALELVQHIKNVLELRVAALRHSGIDVQKVSDSPNELRYKFIIPNDKEYWFSVVFEQDFGPNTLAFLDVWGKGQWRNEGANAIGRMEWNRDTQKAMISLTNFSLLDPNKGIKRLLTTEELTEEIWDKICKTLEQLT